MKYLLVFRIVIMCMLFHLTSMTNYAQGDNINNDYKDIINKLKNWKRYSYKAIVSYPTQENSLTTINRKVYIDKVNKFLYLSDDNQILIINSKYIVQIEHGVKIFKIFNRKEYEKKYNKNFNNVNSLFKDEILDKVLTFYTEKYKNIRMYENGEIKKYLSSNDYENIHSTLQIDVKKSSNTIISMELKAMENSNLKRVFFLSKIFDYSLKFDDSFFATDSYFENISTNKYKLLKYKDYQLVNSVK